MKNFGRGVPLRTALTLASILTLGTGVALLSPAGADADAENIRNVTQQEAQATGEAASTGAVAGPAVAFNVAPVQQLNVQVIAGDSATRENSSQTATNTVNLEQDAVAASGDATTDGSGTAVTGPAVAGSIAAVQQMNIQVIAGRGCEVEQVAANSLDLNQVAVAASGDAEAVDGGNASTGAATATNLAVSSQRNLQVYVCRNGGAGSQLAENAATFDQASGAASGSASAAEGGDASSGSATAGSELRNSQMNRQITIQ